MLQDPIQDTTLHCSVAVFATLLYGEYIHPPGVMHVSIHPPGAGSNFGKYSGLTNGFQLAT